MGPPGGGKQPVTNRFLRHFNFLSFTEMDEESLMVLFSTILGGHLSFKGFGDEFKEMVKPIIEMSIAVYDGCMSKLLPTPAKSHYTFNLRDLSKVFQGLLNSTPKKIVDKNQFLRLWLHESMRVFSDRLVNNEDRAIFLELSGESMKASFGVVYDDIKIADRLVFGDFVEGISIENKIYEEVSDLTLLRKLVDDSLEEYDSESKQPMRLVLFMDAIEHVCKINRILRLPLGNALLCGVGGSGRKSLTRLAAFMADYKVFDHLIIRRECGKLQSKP